MIDSIKDKSGDGYKAFAIALECAVILANRYADMAAEQKRPLRLRGASSLR